MTREEYLASVAAHRTEARLRRGGRLKCEKANPQKVRGGGGFAFCGYCGTPFCGRSGDKFCNRKCKKAQYELTPRGRAARLARRRRFRHSEIGRAVRRRQRQSETGRRAHTKRFHRYRQTEKGKIAHRRDSNKRLLQKRAAHNALDFAGTMHHLLQALKETMTMQNDAAALIVQYEGMNDEQILQDVINQFSMSAECVKKAGAGIVVLRDRGSPVLGRLPPAIKRNVELLERIGRGQLQAELYSLLNTNGKSRLINYLGKLTPDQQKAAIDAPSLPVAQVNPDTRKVCVKKKGIADLTLDEAKLLVDPETRSMRTVEQQKAVLANERKAAAGPPPNGKDDDIPIATVVKPDLPKLRGIIVDGVLLLESLALQCLAELGKRRRS